MPVNSFADEEDRHTAFPRSPPDLRFIARSSPDGAGGMSRVASPGSLLAPPLFRLLPCELPQPTLPFWRAGRIDPVARLASYALTHRALRRTGEDPVGGGAPNGLVAFLVATAISAYWWPLGHAHAEGLDTCPSPPTC